MANNLHPIFQQILAPFAPKDAMNRDAEIIDIIENAMSAVHDMDVPFREYARSIFKALAADGFIAPPGAASVLTDCAQFMDGVKPDAVKEGWWSEWDQQVRDRISDALWGHYATVDAAKAKS